MFRGITATTLDVKGRITIPTKYRDEIAVACEGHLVVTADIDRCLLIYPFPEWERIESELLSLPNVKRQVRRWHRLYLGYAKPCDIDSQSRLLLPPELRDFAGLDKNIFLVGQGNKFELWDEQSWQHNCESWLDEETNSDEGDSLLDSLKI
ncbi:MAG: division/cell wall cluster transcriptional repressor MraZ [Proteobacteria bacterium]|jgi:MraZ protein|nr:division/cell wall cluster transcriptional repressor MraZ [Pseudomonadota bacterium]